MKHDVIEFAVPSIGQDEINEVVETLKSGWITMGAKTKKFEELFAAFLGIKYAISVNSATSGLHLALDCCGIKEGDEVILPTMTFVATAEAVEYLGAKPVLVDCDEKTFNLSVEDVKKKITPKTKAIIPVHMAGQPADILDIINIAKGTSIKIIEDAAHALPSRINNKIIGSIGDATVFSFYATKTLTTGEGGMITTDDGDIANNAQIKRLHGMDKDAWKRYDNSGSWEYDVTKLGYKYNMTDIMASIGIHQLTKVNSFRDRRAYIAQRYTDAFSKIDEIITPFVHNDIQHSWHLYIIKLNLNVLSLTRNDFMNELKNLKVNTSVHFKPLHMFSYFKNKYDYSNADFPNASSLFDRIVSLPIYPSMTEEDINYVIDVVIQTVHKNKKLKERQSPNVPII
ncbi:MAG: DegT/DnrJ/EryC1/StrS family aminotransferase [bacterium]|jgi:perosamine synthetase